MEKLTFKAFHNGKGFASYDLRERVDALQLKDEDILVSFAYTDYGGDFGDKVAIAFFKEKYKENILIENTVYYGENAVLYGEVAGHFLEAWEKYPLGFEDIEDFYFEMEREQEEKDFEFFLNDCKRHFDFDHEKAMEWLQENRSGYYSMHTSGLDFCSSELEKTMLEADILKEKLEA